MTQKGYDVLKALSGKYSRYISTVVAARDPNIQKDYYDEIRELCLLHGYKFYDRKEDYEIRTPYTIAISWRWLIRSSTELIVFHDSLLPKYRGFNPLVTALINRDTEIGVTALFASDSYDRGRIIAQSALNINYPIKIQEAIDAISKNYSQLACVITDSIAKEIPLMAVEQDEKKASYSLWRDNEDYQIDWGQSSEYIKRFVDAVGAPYKGAQTNIYEKPARVKDVEVMEDVFIANRTSGKVVFIIDEKPVIVCGQGLLKICELVDDVSGESILPLTNFRTRFK